MREREEGSRKKGQPRCLKKTQQNGTLGIFEYFEGGRE